MMAKGILKRFIRTVSGSCIAYLVSSSLAVGVHAMDIDGVAVPDRAVVEGDATELQLNGAGYRTKFVFDIYIGALYTPEVARTRDAVQAQKGPKRILMHMVYDEVSHEKMSDAWREGFEENSSDEALDKLASRLEDFIAFFPDLHEGDVILLDYVPSAGTRVTINGELKGVIEGADFYRALLDVWLGEEPADDDLKEAMLGSTDD